MSHQEHIESHDSESVRQNFLVDCHDATSLGQSKLACYKPSDSLDELYSGRVRLGGGGLQQGSIASNLEQLALVRKAKESPSKLLTRSKWTNHRA